MALTIACTQAEAFSLWKKAEASREETAALRSEMREDARMLRLYAADMERTLGAMEASPVYDRKRTRPFDLTERGTLYTLWGAMLDYLYAAEDVEQRHSGYAGIKDRASHVEAFMLSYAAYLTKLSGSIRLIGQTIDNDLYEKKLDDEAADFGIPAGMYAKLKYNTIHLKDVTAINLGYAYYKYLGKDIEGLGVAGDAEMAWLPPYIEAKYKALDEEFKKRGVEYFSRNGLDIVKDSSFTAWFPVQKSVAKSLSGTKVTSRGFFITEEQMAGLDSALEPGDMLLGRRNWYMSNVGLPGFWPHAMLYTGTYEEMSAYFDSDESVRQHFAALGEYKGLMDYLERRWPEAMERMRRERDAQGNRIQIIEAVAKGVILNPLEVSTHADYIVAMRPRLGKLDKAKAIVEAFSHVGKPYDFNFDFITDSTIVCSELLYKAYMRAEGKAGITMQLTEIAGRLVVTPNNIARKFDEEYGTQQQELDFVYFLDGSEQDGRAYVHGVEEFRGSHRRPKWDVSLK